MDGKCSMTNPHNPCGKARPRVSASITRTNFNTALPRQRAGKWQKKSNLCDLSRDPLTLLFFFFFLISMAGFQQRQAPLIQVNSAMKEPEEEQNIRWSESRWCFHRQFMVEKKKKNKNCSFGWVTFCTRVHLEDDWEWKNTQKQVAEPRTEMQMLENIFEL